jgi:SPP1 family predicted phage head-tail adaptor
MMDPGRLRHRLVLEAPVETADDAGGVVRSYATAATVWAAIEPLAPRETVDADGLAATLTHRITIRADVTVTTRHRFKLGTRVLRILTVRDPDECGRFIEIGAQERRD